MAGDKIRVGVIGALGRMGREVVKAVLAQPDLDLVMTVATRDLGHDAAVAVGLAEACGTVLESDLKQALANHQPHAVVDFTTPQSVYDNTNAILDVGARAIVGTTGLTAGQMAELDARARAVQSAVLVAPNFAMGAVLLMKFAQEASRYFEHAEIIELHHNRKLDAPSGTALRTAEMMRAVQPRFGPTNVDADEKEAILGARGGVTESNLHIHSVRLPGMVAHQEVIFGATGETLTLRHDTIDRTCFMPGVMQAIRKIGTVEGLVYGLENLL